MAQNAAAYAAQCKFTANPKVTAGLGQALFVNLDGKVRTDAELLQLAVKSWSPKGYNAVTGRGTIFFSFFFFFFPSLTFFFFFTAVGVSHYYKQLISSNVKNFGCAINRGCKNNAQVVVCSFNAPPPKGPAYPALVLTPVELQQRKQAISAIALVRQGLTPKPKTPLPPVSWSPELEVAAVNALKSNPPPEHSTVGTLVYVARNAIVANAAVPAVFAWSAARRFYRIRENICGFIRHAGFFTFFGRRWRLNKKPILVARDRRVCRRFTQLVSARVTHIGCAQRFFKGSTYFLCKFNADAGDDRPFQI